ncbi:MAG: hypothetical protein IKR76_06395 [Ruminococcus sp.]|nr:hypothetical protein [Ruminococcus sp.]
MLSKVIINLKYILSKLTIVFSVVFGLVSVLLSFLGWNFWGIDDNNTKCKIAILAAIIVICCAVALIWGLFSSKKQTLYSEDNVINNLQQDRRSKEYFIAVVSKVVVNTLVTHLITASQKNIEALSNKDSIPQNIHSLNIDLDENKFIKKTISYDEFDNEHVTEIITNFKHKLSKAVLYSQDVQRTDSKGRYIIKNLFEAYYTNPQQLPDTALKNLYKSLSMEGYEFSITDKYYKIDSSKLRFALTHAISDIRGKRDIKMDICIMRIICDYIAGMTDNFAINEYEKLYG